MAVRRIITLPDPQLRLTSSPVVKVDAAVRTILDDMIETMLDAPGVGLAAPQVYQPLRLFVFRVPGGRKSDDPEDIELDNTVMINPTVELIGEDRTLGWEGCLSIPTLRAAVPRANRIRYRGTDCDGKVTEREVTGFHARIVQHEYDHLDGILYTMRIDDFRYFGFTEELDRVGAQR